MSNIPSSRDVDLPRVFKAGSIIFAEGKTSKHLYLVKRGEVRLVKFKGQNLQNFQICREREILNEVAILTNKPNTFTAVAKTEVELVLVEQKDIMSVLKNGPSWVPDIFETLCERLQSTLEMIEEHNLVTDKDPRLVFTKEDEAKCIQALAEFNSNN